jgi:2-C-methyl-D-erythritol 4-phosphate cytidylyltransferase
MKKYAIVVAGGSGTRMQSVVPKQFIPIGGLPVLMQTLKRFIDYPEAIEIILVLPKDHITEWKKLCKQYQFNPTITIVEGGASRFQSVKNGLNHIPDNMDGLVAIHDGVRPFITKRLILENFRIAEEYGSAITAIPLKDSLRTIKDNKSKAVNRTDFKLIQTPQTFLISLIKKAFNRPEDSSFTDDATVFEADHGAVVLSEGSYQNIKITSPEDLLFAEAILTNFTY